MWQPVRYPTLLIVFLFTLVVNTASAQDADRPALNRWMKALENAPGDTNRIRLYLNIGKFHIFKPGELKTDLDSGEYFIRQARVLSNSLKLPHFQHESQIMEVVLTLERGNEKAGYERFSKAIAVFKAANDKSAEAALRFRYGIWLTTRGTYLAEVLQQFDKAAKLYHESGQPIQEINTLKEIASVHFDQGKINLAESELLQVLAKYRAIHYPHLQRTYNLLSTVARVKGNFDKSLKYAYLSLSSMHTSIDSNYAANYYADLARIYMEVGNNAEGIKWYKKALNTWRKRQRATFAVFITAGYISRDMIANGKAAAALSFSLNLAKELPPITDIQQACFAQNLADCFTALQHYTQAEKYYLRSLMYYKRSEMDFENSQEAQLAIGRFYLLRKSYPIAGYHLRKALNFNPQKLSTAALKETHLLLFRVDSAQGNYISSINHFKLHKQLSDSILAIRKTREIEELHIKYETDKKIKDLALLNNQNKLQQNTLRQVNIKQRYTLGVLGLLLIISGLLFNQYRLKNRNNSDLKYQKQEISEKNHSLQKLLAEREWLLKEIHHRVKNNLQIVISLLNSQSSYLDNSIALAAIKESQHRMYSISLIHQLLYQSDSLALIDINKYIVELTTYLKESFNLNHYCYFNLRIPSLFMDLNQAIPVGLILNEALTNAIKYAFSTPKYTKISITLEEDAANHYIMRVSDNGPGFPNGFDIDNCQSLGINLMIGLSNQLGGQIEFARVHDLTTVQIKFPRKLPSDDAEINSSAYN